MKVTTPEISWHERDPIYSVDIQPGTRKIKRLVSGGVDKYVRIWQIKEDMDGKPSVDFLANLKRHTKAVNVCRFSPDGEVLATAGDDSVIIFWKLSDTGASNNIFEEDEETNIENWSMQKVLRGHLEDIYDLSWSADGKYMISGSVDNSAILWDLTKDQKMALFNDHQSFVQGVAWDPKNIYVSTLSTDRACRIFNIAKQTCVHTIRKMSLPVANTKTEDGENKESKPKSFRMFHDDTMRSFFRRLTFSPDGELLFVPSGLVETDPVVNATFIFSRHNFTKPAIYLPSPEKVTIAVRCCPTKFQLRKVKRDIPEDKKEEDLKEWEKYKTLFCLPYRIVFAVATEDSVQLYDTQQPQPFAFITNIHYHQLSDVAWSSDGCNLVVSSTDGYCTLATFTDGELGQPYIDPNTVIEKSENTVKQDDIAMETDPCSDDLHLVLDTSTDASDTRETTASDVDSPAPPRPAMTMKVKSADGKPRNIQITTLTSTNNISSNTGPAKIPEIKVRSADGKQKNVQITTLASYTSPKSKGNNSKATKAENSSSDLGTPKKGVLKEKTDINTDSDCVIIDEAGDKNACTPKREGSSESTNTPNTDKPTPKRVQLTTIQLFSNSQSPKTNKNGESGE